MVKNILFCLKKEEATKSMVPGPGYLCSCGTIDFYEKKTPLGGQKHPFFVSKNGFNELIMTWVRTFDCVRLLKVPQISLWCLFEGPQNSEYVTSTIRRKKIQLNLSGFLTDSSRVRRGAPTWFCNPRRPRLCPQGTFQVTKFKSSTFLTTTVRNGTHSSEMLSKLMRPLSVNE